MHEFVIFKSFNIIAEIQYNDEYNTIFYTTDRLLEMFERYAIECSILHRVAEKYGYYERRGALSWLGADKEVIVNYRRKLRMLKEQTRRAKEEREQDIDAKVKALMASIQN